MADSDDEYDRRRRDKFRRERSDNYDRSREREDRRRDDWNDRRPSAREWDRGRERRSRGEYRDYERGRRERFSPPRHDMSPQQKRMRRDWDDHGGDPYHGGYDLGYGGGGGPSYAPPQPWGHPDLHLMQPHHGIPIQARLGNIHDMDLGPPPPVMKSFKEFLLSLDDSVDETEAVKRYNEYKIDFRRQQMQDFFLAHKDEEWFRSKYHPDEAGRRKAESHSALQNRLNVYMFLMENSWFDTVSLDIEKSQAIMKVLDAAVIKMEGGTDYDLRILELPSEEEEERGRADRAAAGGPGTEPPKKEEPKDMDNDSKPPADKEKGENDACSMEKGANGGGEAAEGGSEGEEEEEEGEKETKSKEVVPEPKKLSKKRKRKHSGDSEDEASASESDSDSDSNSHHSSDKPAEREEGEEKEDEGEEGEDKDEEEEEECEADRKKIKDEKPKEREREKEEKKPKEDQPPRPRPLHRTCSLFMRSIAPTISKAEIIALCRRYPGFMRVCLSDPQPERRFFRRCWVTFDRSVNIKETCWNLQNIRLRDCELAPGVNRDLARRVRNINGITQHKQVLRNDIKLSAKLIHSLDHRGRLWSHKSRGEAVSAVEVAAQNPILKNITDYLIEEVSAEEEELLGSVGGADAEEGTKEGYPAEITVERDDKLVKVLDRLLLYLRIVHSIDYYNNCEYPSEDEMPNRCGMIHVRGPIPPNRIAHGEVLEWQKTFEERLSPLFSVKEKLSEEEAGKMGRKDPEQEVEKFVLANTQELGKDKWLCPLSGKKFKGPEFVRKHILNKHGDKIEEVKREVMFFNNFLMDAKRPSLPEMKPPPPLGPGPGVLSPGMPFPPQGLMGFGPGQPRPPVMGYGGGPPYPPNQYGGGRGNYDNFRGQAGGYPGKPRNNSSPLLCILAVSFRMSRGDPRNIIEYRDLDAPDDIDFF
ncbi:serrate RNA effector molecule homolog isoform X1 [Oncorhynchus mykiss]|uniref:serrate RNA effector molecule homolog isoform X1 n=1 Tax=Oncorhynchus mykiss TaxID=8022 RepID=UPI001877997E|nr:serrate RNA effector molecule homolog isoform X1 [Oncorhynchus mykiss]XP_021479062.2 serrate RNA effector molecule homolog isoform X1 [Oncorhynchus mykiss]XP_021479063.2 serrate RNA effector molecule homolog isoform X1 [Oncorhynchus mykiss]